MSDIGNRIREFLHGSGLDCAEISHACKAIGNGKMHDGIKKIANFMYNDGFGDGKRLGTVQGGVIGSVGTLAFVSIVYITYKSFEKNRLERKRISAHQILGQQIHQELINSQNIIPSTDSSLYAKNDEGGENDG